MERNSAHTSLVIEVEDQEEPEQKTYMIDFDIQDISKDYVVDQVFCGENVTVYALFEVPEGSKKKHENHMLEMSKANPQDGYELDQKSSSKTLTKEKRLNGYKPSLPLMNSNDSVKIHPKEPESGSLYCLQSLSRTYGVMTPERKPSDFEILYNKRASVPKSVKSKFKAVSKGVNTDVVQSPKIMHDVEQAVRFNLSNVKKHETASSKPSCEVIELEMHQSFSSFSSSADSKRRFVKPAPNFFLVPLLVVDDGVLSHFQAKEKVNAPAEKTETASLGTTTEFPELSAVTPEPETKNPEKVADEPPTDTPNPKSGEPAEVDEKKENKKMVRKGKVNVLKEIRKLQCRLNALTKLLESSDLEYEIDSSEGEIADSEAIPNIEEPVVTEPELPREKKRQKHDDLPIFSSMLYSNATTKRKGQKKKRSETPEEKKKNEVLTPVKSNSLGLLSLDTIHSIPAATGEKQKSNVKFRKASNSSGINRMELENRKGVGLSKSEICNYITVFDNKVNVLKKCFSSFLKDDRVEAFMLKKVKNSSFKLEGSPKSNKRIIQKEETHLDSTMGDEAIQEPKNSKDVLSLSTTKPSENVSELDSKKNLNEEEGDAKLVYSKQSLVSHVMSIDPEKLEVHFNSIENCTTTAVSDNLLLTDRSSNPSEVSKLPSVMLDPVVDVVLDVEKVPLDVEKSALPKKTQTKREVKTTAKKSNPIAVKEKPKPAEKFPKVEKKEFGIQEPVKQKLLLTNRKSGGGRANANSKLHIDKLIKLESRSSSRTSNLTKSGTDEKFGPKGASRPSSRRREPVPETVADECKEKEEKTSKVVSEDSFPGKKPEVSNAKDDEPVTLYKKPETSGDFSSDAESNLPTFSSPSVVLEVFTEKPNTPEESSLTLDKQIIVENNEVIVRTEGITLEVEKPVLKSVWALTKVLIFEDGTKKVEVLEASMNPPEDSITNKKSDHEN